MSVQPTSSSIAPISFQGIMSGLPTASIIQAYLSIDEAPLKDLQVQQSTVQSQIADYQAVQSDLSALESAASSLSAPGSFAGEVSASSSNSAVATATTGAGASVGSATFSVDQLATADTLVSAGTVASTSDVVASGSLLVASGGSALGISSVSGSGLASGNHTITVTQSSAGASVTGSVNLGSGTTTITAGVNDTLALSIDGTAVQYTIAAGTYDASQLAQAITNASGGTLKATLNSSGQLQLTTTQQGSAATLSIGAGDANATLGLTQGASGSGVNGMISVDGTSTTVTNLSGTSSTTLNLASGTGGTLTAVVGPGAGLVAGTMQADNVSVGSGTLASVVSAINAAGLGVDAQALQVGTNAYALELSSTATGAGNDVSISPSAFSSSSLGNLSTTTAGQDAKVSLGGPGGYVVSSSTNTMTGLLPGVSIQLQSVSSSPVTISVAPDGEKAASAVGTFVDAANKVLSTINTDLAYNAKTGVAGPLNGDVQLEALAQSILGAVGSIIGTSGLASTSSPGSAAGLSLSSSGTLSFDPTAFAAAYDANPSAVAALFTQGGSFTPASGAPPASVSLVYASNTTQAGSYALVVSHSATQAVDNGTVSFASSSSTLAGGEAYTITSGSQSASYTVSAGETLSQVASGMDKALAAAGMNLSAQVVATSSGYGLQITSAQYGSSASFGVAVSGTDELGLAAGSPFVGTNVAGTINGVAASGQGQVLSAPSSDPTLGGLSLQVDATNITAATSLGTFSYAPGIAQALSSIAAQATASPSGLLPARIAQLQNSSQEIGTEINFEQQVVNEQQQALQQEFNNLETTLATLKSESAFVASSFGGSASVPSTSSTSSSSTGSTSGG